MIRGINQEGQRSDAAQSFSILGSDQFACKGTQADDVYRSRELYVDEMLKQKVRAPADVVRLRGNDVCIPWFQRASSGIARLR